MFLDQTPVFWLTAVLAVLLVGVSKGGFGGGAGVAATPLLALTLPVPEAAALLLPLLIAADVAAVYHYRRRFDARELAWLLPSAFVGVLLGALLFGRFAADEALLRRLIGLLALAFVLYGVLRRALLRRLETRPLARPWALPLGLLSGFASTLAHVGGPPATVYLLPRRLGREVFVGTSAVFFFVLNLVKLVPYALLGLLQVGDLGVILALLPVVPCGIVLGVALNRLVGERAFSLIVYALLFVTGLELLGALRALARLVG